MKDHVPNIDDIKRIYPAEYEAFSNDDDSILFHEWWDLEGEKIWLSYYENKLYKKLKDENEW